MTEMFAISKAGHDKGQMYVILKEEGEYLYLVDGKTRGVDNPKKKKKKHCKLIKKIGNERIADKLASGERVSDADLRKALKLFLKEEVI